MIEIFINFEMRKQTPITLKEILFSGDFPQQFRGKFDNRPLKLKLKRFPFSGKTPEKNGNFPEKADSFKF